jgi:ribosomal-protein-alanine N-acetyltransferase
MLETSRLWLRRLRPSDEPALIALDSDPEVMRYVGSPAGVRPRDETADRVSQRIRAQHGPHGWWLIEGKRDRTFHGLGLLLPMPDGDDVEVGYRLVRASWGQGVATEATSALVDYALGTLALPRVVAVVYPENRASRRVLEKLGFVHSGLGTYKGAAVDHFRLDADRWQARRPVIDRRVPPRA